MQDTFEMLTVAFGESIMSRTQVQLLYKRFKQGQEDIIDDACPGLLSTSTTDEHIEAAKKMILNDRRIPNRDDAGNIKISFNSCQAIFTDVLSIKRAAAKIIPKLLHFEQKQRRMDIVQDMLTMIQICSKMS